MTTNRHPDHSGVSSASSRALVIGLDGATFDVLVPLAQRGVMPNLRALMASSALAQLNSTDPFITPVAWSTFQTGCDPRHHGVFDYRYLDHAQRQLRLNHAGRLACPTLFDSVAKSGGQVVSLNLPMTYPRPNNTPGIVVGGLDSPSAADALAPYPEFAQRLRASGAAYDLKTIWKRQPLTFDELADGVRRTRAAFHGRVTAAKLADAMTDWRLMVVQFQTLDSLQHRCWRFLDIDGATGDANWIAETSRALQALDDCVGELLELAARRRAAAVVVSDHGFGAFREKIALPELLRRRGLVTPAQGRGNLTYLFSRTQWRLKKWLHRRRHRQRSTAAMRRPLEALAPIDWRRSVGFTAHGELAGLVYLNDQRRFGRGPIETTRQREQAEAEFLALFRDAQHPLTGERLFDNVFSTQQRFACDPIERLWPDIVAIPAPGFQTRSKFDRQRLLMRADPTLTGTHRREGVLMIHASGLAVGQHHIAQLRDVAPTILNLLGLPLPESMTGQALAGPKVSGAVGPPVSTVGPMPASAESCVTPAQQAVVEERLRQLGYLE